MTPVSARLQSQWELSHLKSILVHGIQLNIRSTIYYFIWAQLADEAKAICLNKVLCCQKNASILAGGAGDGDAAFLC